MSLLDTASLIVTPNGYKDGTLYSVIPSDGSGDLSVTRATTATRVNSQGLVELVPYNLLGYSEDFTNASWLKGASTITGNTTTAPNGTTTADTFTGNGASDLHIVLWQTDLIGVGNTISVYAKKNTNDFLQIYTDFVNTDFANFDLANGTTGSVGSSVISSSIESVGNGWYRCSFVVGSSASKFVNFCLVTSASASRAQTNSLSTSVFLWGAQLNEGTLKPYQKTETRLNIPRLDYSNGTCPSILVEPQRTNLLTYSENLTQWTANIQIASTQLVSNPLTGVNNATKITKVSGTNDPWVRQIVSAGNGTYTYSVYLWTDAGQQTDIELYMYNASISEVYTLSITLTTTPTRYEFDATFANTGGSITARIDLVNSGDQYIYAYGAQLEAGSYATSYIPTTSASVTRNADVISKTGISSLIGQTEGAVMIDINIDSSFAQNDMRFIDVSNGSAANWYFIGTNLSNEIRFYFRTSNTAYVSFTTPLTNGRHKLAFAYANNDYVAYVDGVQVYSTSTLVVGSTSQVVLANDYGGFTPIKQITNAAALWKTRLTNTQLAQLTTI